MSNVSIQGGNDCTVSAVGSTDAGNDRKKVIIAGLASGGNVTLGGSGVAVAIPANTFLDLGAFQGAILTTSTAKAIILS